MKNMPVIASLQQTLGENTYNALKCLIDNSYYAQSMFAYDRSKENLEYLKEFCTIRVGTSRQSGHTTAALKLAKEHFHNAIFISYTLAMTEKVFYTASKILTEDVIHAVKNKIITKNGKYLFGSVNNLNSFRGEECEIVFIDCVFLLSKKQENDIYMTFGPSMKNYPQKFFVFIQ